jgi:hypothetical protein
MEEPGPADAGAPDMLAALRAFVAAHAVPDPRTGSRDPIMYLPFRGGLMHPALGEDRPSVDDALIEELHDNGLISIDYGANSWQITPTSQGRRVVEEEERSRSGEPAADIAPLRAAFERQAEVPNPLAWPAVRPVLEALRAYWQESGYPAHGISLLPVADKLADSAAPAFAATIRALVASGYLDRGSLGGTIVDDDGRRSEFPGEVALTDRAHAVLDGWPGASPSELVENLLAVLVRSAAEEGDPTRRRRLETVTSAIKELGVSVTSEVIAKVVAGGVG